MALLVDQRPNCSRTCSDSKSLQSVMGESELKFYTDKFGIGPKIKSRVFYRLFKKT